MKNLFKAILISFVLLLIYTFGSLIISLILFGPSGWFWTPSYLLFPVSLPPFIFDKIAPEIIQSAVYSSPFILLIYKVVMFFCNVLIYCVPIYLLLLIWSKANSSGEKV